MAASRVAETEGRAATWAARVVVLLEAAVVLAEGEEWRRCNMGSMGCDLPPRASHTPALAAAATVVAMEG